jgi:hypothetical protein
VQTLEHQRFSKNNKNNSYNVEKIPFRASFTSIGFPASRFLISGIMGQK